MQYCKCGRPYDILCKLATLNTHLGNPNYIECVPLGDDPVKNREMLLSGKYRELDTQEHGPSIMFTELQMAETKTSTTLSRVLRTSTLPESTLPSAPPLHLIENDQEIIIVKKVQ